MSAWGYHLVLDCNDCDLSAMKNREHIIKFTKQLVKDIDMTAYGEPQVVHFGTGDKEGYTLLQLIETSNICGHFANDRHQIFLDVFSCKEFNKDKVIELVDKYFIPGNILIRELERGREYNETQT